MEISGLNTPQAPTWCPGCGNFGILAAIKTSISELELDPRCVVLAGDVGCSGKLPFWINTNGFTGLHGRVIALAQGIKMGNPKLTVLASGGDGGIYGEGINHLISAARRNIDITVIVHNNFVYGLTTGQYSPTSRRGFKTKASPEGSFESPINPLQLALVSGASFVARGFAGDIQYLSSIIKAAILHPGFALVDILQPCVTFNREQTSEYYKERVYKLEESNYQPKTIGEAIEKAGEWLPGNETSEVIKIPTGIFYKDIREAFPLKELAL
ncbi:MAG: thiamine pyrophosphate-dependent enzyme [Patescibacteria group bacterium]